MDKNAGHRWLRNPITTKALVFFRRHKTPRKGDSTIFPFLDLPRELREMIYDYFREPPNVAVHEEWSMPLPGEVSRSFTYGKAYGPQFRHPAPHQPPASSGIVAYYGELPNLTIRLICKQIHDELWDRFLSTTFEVGSLTPHSDEWRFDPTYQKLNKSSRLPLLRHLLVKVDLASLKMCSFIGAIKYEEIGVEDCVLKLQFLAEMLLRVLRRRGASLRRITIDWKDDFPEEDWQLKASVLYPFGTLKNVQLRLGELVITQNKKTAVKKKLEETLDALSSSE